MMILKYFMAPLLGGIIGYITNDIAIKMLFHPRNALYISKFHIPFTPGLIPQQKNRIARSVAHVVSEQLLDSETLKDFILSQRALDTLRANIETEIEKISEDPRTPRDLLSTRFTEEQIKQTEDNLSGKAAILIMQKLTEAHIGSIIAKSIAEDVQKLMPVSSFSFVSDMLSKSMGGVIDKVVEEKLQEKGPALIQRGVYNATDDWLDTPLCEIYRKYQKEIPEFIDGIISVYKDVLDVNLEKVLAALNIENIIAEKVISFDSAQLEEMIFGILSKELKAIVYLGAGLGFLMGFINLLL